MWLPNKDYPAEEPDSVYISCEVPRPLVCVATGKDFTYFFDQYLKYPAPPVFQYRLNRQRGGVELTYHWQAAVPGFAMPIKVDLSGSSYTTLSPTGALQTTTLRGATGKFRVASELFYGQAADQSGRAAEKK